MEKECATKKIIIRNGKEIFVCDETRSQLLPILQGVQAKKGYISDKDMQKIAGELGIHPVEVYSVITFYSFLTVEKKGKHMIRISNCISGEIAGSEKIVKEFEKVLKIKVGETTKDKKITLEGTSCIGMCDEAPAIMVDDRLIGKVTPKMINKIIKELKCG